MSSRPTMLSFCSAYVTAIHGPRFTDSIDQYDFLPLLNFCQTNL